MPEEKSLPTGGAPASASDPAAGRPRRRRRPLRALLLGSVLALFAGEIVCRIRFGAPMAEREPLMEVRANRARGFEMIPSSVHYTYLHEVRVNSLGLRGPEARPQSEAPIVVALGDSMTYGQGVAEADTLPALVETVLSSRGKRVQVLNAGVRSYDTRQEIALLEELLQRVHPSVVVLFWFGNDLDPADVDGWYGLLERSGPLVFDVRARMEGDVRRNWRLIQLARTSALLMKLHDAYRVAAWKSPTPEAVEERWKAMGDDLARLAELSRAHDFDVLVAVIPGSEVVGARASEDSMAARLLPLAAGHGLAGVSLLAPLCALWEREGACVLPYDGHYDGRANAAMAEEVADELEQRFARRLAQGDARGSPR